MPRLERAIQKEGEKALKAAFGKECHVWTCDTGGFVPWSSIQGAIARLAKDPSRWRSIMAALHPSKVGITGGADTQGAIRGRWVGIEWKRPGQKQRESQREFERDIRRAGGVYIVATSEEEALEGIITAMGLEDERDAILDRAFGPKSRLGRLRAARAAKQAEAA